MMVTKTPDISGFFIVGINYKKTDAAIRGQFAIGHEQYEKILGLSSSFNVTELFVLSTCNRTEIYGFADNSAHLAALLCTQTNGELDAFLESAYTRKGAAAIEHLFEVAAGLDSQILGDYEIVGQIKQAVKFARERRYIGPFLERLVNCVLQASKAIKNQTALSGGTVSVSFAAIQYIRERIADPAGRNVLVIGTGKIGRNTCRNLVDYLGTRNLTLINRTESKAAELAAEIGVNHAPADRIAEYVHEADIILVATNADQPTLLKSWLEAAGDKLIIDLSIPCNVEKSAAELPGITLAGVDELSRIKDETLQKREAEVPKAKVIIAEHIADWMEWYNMRRHVPVLKAVKTKLKELFPATDDTRTEQQIQRVINGMANKMRLNNQGGCQFIEAINEYISTTE